MRIKLDENMPSDFEALLRSSGHDVATAREENLSGADDPVVLEKATKEERLLMILDADFADIRRFPLGGHGEIVVFRLQDQRWAVMKEPAQRLLESDLLEKLEQGLAVVDENRVRFRLKKGNEE